MEKKLILNEEKIIKQNRRLGCISFVFSINIFFAAIGIFVLVFLLKEEFNGFKIFKIIDFIKSLNFLRIAVLLSIMSAIVINLLVSAYFVRVFPKKKRDKIANGIKSMGKRDKGEIVKTEIYKKSIYEVIYKAFIKLDGKEKIVFCFYTVDKSEPSPLGEKWRLFYDENSGFAVLTKRLVYGTSPQIADKIS